MSRVRFLEHKTLHAVGSFLRLDLFLVTYPKFEHGEMTGETPLVNVHRGDSVTGLLHLVRGDQQSLLLVEQFRLPTLLQADTGQPDMDQINQDPDAGRMIELMAGMRKPGEPWLEAFRRECVEETGIDPDDSEYISSFYPSPGACSEQIHLYYGRINWPDDKAWPETDASEAAGFGDESEDIRRHFVTPAEFLEMVENGTLKDGKCFVAAEWMRRAENADRFGFDA
ncbi:MAG: NUDIX hydrolase [Pseudomonadota bacterium]